MYVIIIMLESFVLMSLCFQKHENKLIVPSDKNFQNL